MSTVLGTFVNRGHKISAMQTIWKLLHLVASPFRAYVKQVFTRPTEEDNEHMRNFSL
jgi:hypothetical protein